jgi:hypothetical protein
VHNLKGIELSNAQKQALLLGKNFVPCTLMTPKNVEEAIEKARLGMKKLKDTIKWRIHFETAVERKSTNPLRVKSKGLVEPPTCDLDGPILQYFSDLDRKLEATIAKIRLQQFVQPNELPTHIQRAIADFKNNKDIRLCIVDKDGGIVPVTILFYDTQIDLHLLNKINYLQLLSKPDLKVLFVQMREIIRQHRLLEHTPGQLSLLAKYILQ